VNGVIARKLAAPDLPPSHIERPRPLRLLDEAAAPVILVCAPLGCGKSVVLSELARLRADGAVVGWLTLAPGDELLFWEYVVSALRAGGLDTATASPASRMDIPTRLIASLSCPGVPVTLVLDDFHEVRDPDVLAQFEAFLEAVPERFRVCLAARADPPLPLHRWRLRGLLAEVRAAELSFTVEETGRLMAAHGVTLPVRALAELNALTEGWAVGLRLAAVELSGSPDPEQRLSEFCRHDRGMADYLLEEVVSRLAPDVVEVLTCTALLDEVDAGLTAAMTGRDDGATILAALERANALITRLARPGEWYRYHPLLRQTLADELAHRQPSRVPALHRRAADWYSRHGPPSHAIRHYLAAGQWMLAVDVLARSWPDVLASSRRDVFAGPVAVPEDLVHGDPDLALAFAADCLHRDDRAGLHALVRLAGHVVGKTGGAAGGPTGTRPDRDAMITAFRLVDGQLNGDRERVMAAVGPMLETEAEAAPDTEPWRPLALIALGESWLQTGRFDSAREPLRAALAVAEERALEHVRLAATSRLSIAYAFLGQLTDADHAARAALTIVGRHGGRGDEDEERARIALAQIALERFRLGDATYQLDKIFRTRPPTSRILWVLAWTVRLRIRAAGGDPDGAHAELVALRRDLTGAELDDPAVADALDFADSEFELARGRRSSARRKLAVLEQLDHPPGWTAVLQGRLQMAERQPARALGVSAPYVDVLDPELHRGFAVELCLIHAWAVLLLGNQTKSGRSLETALRLADEEGFRLAFLRAGAPMADLLRGHIRAGTAYPALAGELVAALTEDASPDRAELAEPLSDRELAVLRHVRDVMSNVEIADAMSVSVNTVKTHLKNIYRKLETDSRRDAVRRAHARGEV
jgi:LuxR family maltose regulon positive regulatory protein